MKDERSIIRSTGQLTAQIRRYADTRIDTLSLLLTSIPHLATVACYVCSTEARYR